MTWLMEADRQTDKLHKVLMLYVLDIDTDLRHGFHCLE